MAVEVVVVVVEGHQAVAVDIHQEEEEVVVEVIHLVEVATVERSSQVFITWCLFLKAFNNIQVYSRNTIKTWSNLQRGSFCWRNFSRYGLV